MSEESFHKNFMNESTNKKNLVNLVDYSAAGCVTIPDTC